jgi:peptidoglycan hydrolase-like protein with peptidoglycan-binding domain
VRAVQSQANSRVPNLLVVDGAFGPRTDAVVRAFQGATGLATDGIVGPLTWNALVSGFLTATSGADAAQRVFNAWSQADQATAAKNATPAAVAQLFARSFSPTDGWTFAGSSGAAGSVFSRWTRAGGELVLRANNSTGTPFFYVTSATFTP